MSNKPKNYNKALKQWARLSKSYEGNENMGFDPDATCNAACNDVASDVSFDQVFEVRQLKLNSFLR